MFDIHGIVDLAEDARVNGEEFAARIAARAAVIAPHVRGDARHVFIAHGNSIAFFVDLFAVWQAGGCAVCLNQGLTLAEFTRLVEFVEPVCVLVRDGTAASGFDFAGLPAFEVLETSQSEVHPAPWALDDPALMLFTSGTTGAPKGVTLSRRAVLARVALNTAHIGSEILARTMNVLPTHFGHGLIGNCLTPLSAGGTLFLNPAQGVATAADVGKTIDANAITFMSSVPGFWKLALRVSGQPDTGSLKRISVGSAPLSLGLWQDIAKWSGADVWNMYGLTETANWVGGTNNPCENALGKLWGGQAAVRDEDGSVRSQGEGELLLRVPSLMTAYFKRPDLTEDVLQHGWYRTGDMGRVDKEGLHLLGRARYMINVDGTKIYPEEIDLFFETHDAIHEACAFAIPDPVSGERVALAVAGAALVGLLAARQDAAWARAARAGPRARAPSFRARFPPEARPP